MIDSTEDQRLQDVILRRNRELSTLNAVANVISQSLSVESTLVSALEQVTLIPGIDSAVIHLLNRESGELRLAMYRGLAKGTADAIVRLRPGEATGGRTVQSGEPIVIPDVSKYRRGKGDVFSGQRLYSVAQIPLQTKGTILGILCVATHKPHEFEPDQIQLLTSIGSQIAMAVENAQLYEALQIKQKSQGELLRQVIAAQEDERKRIARELHDETSQSLVALMAAIEMVTERSEGSVEIKMGLQRMRALAEHTLEEVHTLIHDLRPTLLDDLGLTAAIRSCAETRLGATGIKLHFDTPEDESRLPSQIETALFRVAQEAISNIARHSNAENATISVKIAETEVVIDIEDDGRGFTVSEMTRLRDGQKGLGLLGMKERMELLGGTLTIHSRLAGGTRLIFQAPILRDSQTEDNPFQKITDSATEARC